MEYKVLNDFEKEEDVSPELIKEYTGKLPENLLEVWEKYGFGVFNNKYLKLVNPQEYQEALKASYKRAGNAIPFVVTAFGDILTWEDNKSVGLIKYRKGIAVHFSSGFKYFFNNLLDKNFIEKLDAGQYEGAVKKHGYVEYRECFGYVPLLGLGGSEKIKNIEKISVLECIGMITELVGKVGQPL